MKKKLMVISIAAIAGSAYAQSSVSVAGIVDTSVTVGRGSVANKTQLTTGAYNTSRLIFRGTEDLGSGMSASFWLEAGLVTDDGQGQSSNTNNQVSGQPAAGTVAPGSQGLMFNRRSTVGLSTPWGEVKLGRDFVPQYWNRTLFDAFGASGVGQTIIHNLTITGATSIRASNGIAYFLPSGLGGVYGQAVTYLGENLSNAGVTSHDGTGYGARLGYAAGPANFAVASGYTTNSAGGIHQSNIGGQWDFPLVKVMGQYERESVGARRARGWQLGGLIPVGGAGEIRIGYSTFRVGPATGAAADAISNKIALGYVHNLSKRTALYATYANVHNKNGATFALAGAVTGANRTSSGIDLGIRHSF
ncbi:MAG: porin [Burkholderiales bacterium]|nr:porin [Burkholderiales bacterium]